MLKFDTIGRYAEKGKTLKNLRTFSDFIFYRLVILCLIVVLAGYLVTYPIENITKYNKCKGKTVAMIQNVETQQIYEKAFSHLEYKVSYTYNVDGISYNGTSSWLSPMSALKVGQELDVRFDAADPKISVLEADKDDLAYTLFSLAGMAGIVFIIKQYVKKSRKRKESAS